MSELKKQIKEITDAVYFTAKRDTFINGSNFVTNLNLPALFYAWTQSEVGSRMIAEIQFNGILDINELSKYWLDNFYKE